MNTPGGGGGKGGFPGVLDAIGNSLGGKGGYPYPREMRIDSRAWGSENRKLDVATTFEGFQVWKDRAMMFLSRERPDVRKLLMWAETQSKESLEEGLAAQAASFGVPDLAGVEYAIHDGIKMTILDTLLGRARNCVEQGCELWRTLCAEWHGSAPELKFAKARRYQNPPTCKSVQELWSRLPVWERLGEEVALSGLGVPEWLACAALEQLIPTQLRDSLVARASGGEELKTFATRLAWVKVHMEHARGLAQATAYAPGGGHGKDAAGDVNMYSVEGPPGLAPDAIEGMSWALAESVHNGDWELSESLQHAIYAMKGAKGKGKGKGKPGKGAASPAAAAKGGSPSAEFQGTCRHCGHWGHRLSECRRYTAEMAKNGKGKEGKAGGKGGPKGGKGPPVAQIGEVAADDAWAGEALDGALDTAAAELDEWDLGGICSLRAASANSLAFCGHSTSSSITSYTGLGPATLITSYTGQGPTPFTTSRIASSRAKPHKQLECERLRERQQQQVQQRQQQQQTKTQNSFSPLSALDTDAEEPLAATPAEHAEVLALALANAVGQGDWAQAESLNAAIAAQHGAKGGSRKGLAKGTPGGLSFAALNLRLYTDPHMDQPVIDPGSMTAAGPLTQGQ